MAKKKVTLEEKLEEAIVKDAPYEVPENWVWTKLNVVCDVRDGTHDSPTYIEEGIPLITSKNLKNGKIVFENVNFISAKDHELISKRSKVDIGDILFAMIGTIGNPVLINDMTVDFSIKNVALFKSRNKINNKFVYYYVQSFMYMKQLEMNLKGSTQKFIALGKLRESYIALPPLREQERIVYKIESIFEKLNKAKELIEEAREDFEKRKSAIIYKIINKFSNEKIKLKDCIIFITDKKEPVDGDVYIGLENIGKSKGIIEYGVAENVKSTKTKFNKGDILYGRLRPYLDKHDVADRSGVCSTDILVMRANEKFEPRYIDYILGTLELIRYANENSSGINLPRVSAKVLGEYKIPNINFDQQKKVVKILNKIFEHEDKIEELTDLEEQLELIKKSILAKAFRGQLGTSCEEDESALELLKEILSKE